MKLCNEQAGRQAGMETRARKVQSRRIILFPLPFQGHINPMFQLASILHSRGYKISIIHTQYNAPDPSKYPEFNFHSIPDGLPAANSHQPSDIDSVIFLINLINANCADPFHHCLSRLLSDAGHDFIVTDAIWVFTQDIADKFDLRRIVLRTSSAASFLAFSAIPSLLHQSPHHKNPIPNLPQLKAKDLPSVKRDIPEEVIEFTEKMVSTTKRASCIIFNTFKELEESELAKVQDEFGIPVFAIGPFHNYFSASLTSLLTQDRSSIAWLDKQAPKSVLYVSFGSIATLDESNLLEVAWGLVNSGQPFLWVVRPGMLRSSSSQMLPDQVLNVVRDRSHIVQWAPQQEVLAHPAVAAFFTHCGWNSTLESISEGVPMVCSSFMGDQLVNSRWINDVWRVGVKLEEGLERGEIERAIRRVMEGHQGQEIRNRAFSLKEMAHHCIKPTSGSSYQALDGLLSFISSFESSNYKL